MWNQETVFPSRYLSPELLTEVLQKYTALEIIGKSVQNRPIYAVRVGRGAKKILAWSQMHGNESTTTRGLFDFFMRMREEKSSLRQYSFLLLFQLNPDGSEVYTRQNANGIDLNRDAVEQTQPETKAFMKALRDFSPDLCVNLHDQRTRFTVGHTQREAAISFLAPAANKYRKLTDSRVKSMTIIARIFERFPQSVRQRVGRFDDSFNRNCYGDFLAHKGIPTILIEAGQWGTDYDRVITRRLVYESLLGITQCYFDLDSQPKKSLVSSYNSIPENTEFGFDEGYFNTAESNLTGVRYKEHLENGSVHYVPDEYQLINEEDRKWSYFRYLVTASS
jgi:hypothetical protein